MRRVLLLALLATCARAQAPPDTLDLFVIAGQSNAKGAGGDPAQAETTVPGTAHWVLVTASGRVLLREVGDDERRDGSLGPAFAREYVARTGRRVALYQAAVGSTAMLPEGDQGRGHWSPTYPGPGVNKGPNQLGPTLEALAVLAAGPPEGVAFRPAGVIWAQGETDAIAVHTALYPVEAYAAALAGTVEALRGAFGGPPIPFYLVQTGRRSLDSDGAGAVRQAQRDGAAAGLWTLACDDPVTFHHLGWMWDDAHWNQTGLNHVGAHVAASAALDAPAGLARGLEGRLGAPGLDAGGPGLDGSGLGVEAWPNPARGRLVVAFGLEAPADVRVGLVDALGREVRVLADGRFEPGRHRLEADLSALAPGAYAVRVERGGAAAAARVVVAR